MTTVEVEDPETGERMVLTVVKRGGKEFFQRVPDASLEVALRSPRQLEAMAAFAESAGTSFGRRTTGRIPVAAETVQDTMRLLFPKEPTARQRRAAKKQERYVQLLGEDLAGEMRELADYKLPIRRRLARRRHDEGLAITRRALPELAEMPPPSIY